MMRFSVDTNILVYAAVRQSGPKHLQAIELMRRAAGRDCVVTLQALGEAFRILLVKYKVPSAGAAARVDEWRSAMPVVAADETCLIDAMDAVSGHGWSFWDAMMWATAKRAGCRLLLSEDGDDGRTLGGVTLVNPFASSQAPLLTEALGAVPARARRPRGGGAR
jgi:predicted nucleic acid-binding protein